jgi:thioredoxin-like negative regulator of GroEL
MKKRALLIAPLLLIIAATGCSMIPGTPSNRALHNIKHLRKMKNPADKVPQLADYLSYRAGLFNREQVARAAKDALVETGYPAILYIDASLHDLKRGKQARIYLLRAYTEIEQTGAARRLLDISRDAKETTYLRVEAIKLLAGLHWMDAKPYFKHLSEDPKEPKEIRNAAKSAYKHL